MPHDGKWLAQAMFDTPGAYVLRALADDGALLGYCDLPLRVTENR